MAWGSQGQVFLGEDLMHTRDYSEHTSQIIDDEVEIILRAQEERALEVLARHRGGLDAVARALLDEETIDGETVGRLVDTAYGRPVHEHGVKNVPPIFVASQHGPTGSDDMDGPPEGADGTGADSGGRGSGAGTAPAGTAPHGAAEPTTDSEVSGAARASDGAGAAQPRDAGQANGDGRAGSAPWPPPPPPAGHWPQAPSPMPAPQPPGHWPNQTPWPPPPPPASR
jgi:hypothetical protein